MWVTLLRYYACRCLHLGWPACITKWCNTGCHGGLMITRHAPRGGSPMSWSRPHHVVIIMRRRRAWLAVSGPWWSVLWSASQLATYLLKCIHKLNRGNSTHNNPHKPCPPLAWPSGPVIECLQVTDGPNHHCIWCRAAEAGAHGPGITPSHMMTPSLHPIPGIGVTFLGYWHLHVPHVPSG